MASSSQEKIESSETEQDRDAEAKQQSSEVPPPPPPPPLGSWSGAFSGVMTGGRRKRNSAAPLENVLGSIRCAVFGCNCDE
mmetsp:Transcript_4834/g.11080  ORF Transcript_4834/g.11080 Transcript_4834/m.11080 type:complete len:81 (+) Transcript_4834:87-329(+)